jgi:alcohol dehydrogenase
MVMLSDILPTAYECGVLCGKIKPGHTVAIIGAGAIGLSALLTAQLYTPSEIILIDIDDFRLSVGKQLGATQTINSSKEDAVKTVMAITNQKGVNVAIEAVGVPATFELCQAIIESDGHIANVGVHSKSVPLHLETSWSKTINITTRLVDTVTTPLLLKTVYAKKLNPSKLITHRFALPDIIQAYDIFENAATEKPLKVILTSG